MKKRRREKEEAGEVDVSSLIDVCFLLLIYFLVTSTIVKEEQDLGMALPSSAPSQGKVEIQPMYIYISEDHSVSINQGVAKEVLDKNFSRRLPLLEERLELFASAAKASGSEPTVQLELSADAKQQRVVDVLNALERHGIHQITFLNLDKG